MIVNIGVDLGYVFRVGFGVAVGFKIGGGSVSRYGQHSRIISTTAE